jgi:hypothetical protein
MYSANVRKKSMGKMRSIRLLAVFLVPVVALILGVTAPKVWAWGGGVELDEAEIFFEYNSTDKDLGIHFFLDGEGWKRISIFTPNWRRSVTVSVSGKLGKIGLTEIFSESAEPLLCPEDEEDEEDCTPGEIQGAIEAFQAQFPEGEYRFYGWTVDRGLLYGTATLTHELPAAPGLVFPDPEAEENVADPKDTVIKWSDTSEEGDPEIVRYEVVVEFEDEDERVFKFVAQVPADPDAEYQWMTVPQEFFDSLEGLEGEYKAEVLAIAGSKNATIVEHEFELEEGE